jgi:hypothetical protein
MDLIEKKHVKKVCRGRVVGIPVSCKYFSGLISQTSIFCTNISVVFLSPCTKTPRQQLKDMIASSTSLSLNY